MMNDVRREIPDIKFQIHREPALRNPLLGRSILEGAGAGYLKAHDVPFEEAIYECDDCALTGGPAEEVLRIAQQQETDLIVMGGTRRGFWGELLWPELAREVVWNATVPVLIWY